MQDIWRLVRAPDPELDDVVRRELLIQSGEAARVSNLLGFGLLATTTGVLLVAGSPRPGLAAWFTLTLVWSIFFHFAVPGLVTGPARDRPPAGPGRWFTLLQLVAGAVWGSVCILIRPGSEHPALIAVPVAVLMLSNAANLLFCSATPGAYRAFHAAIVSAGAVGLSSQGHWALMAFIVFGAVGAPQLARYGYQQVAGARLTARQNALLAQELRQERASVEQVNLRLSEANAELKHMATRDPLTGLPNRALFFDHLGSTLTRSRRAGRRLGVIYFDLDRFKIVNDSLGHAAGDELLRQVGDRVSAVLRSSDVLARLGCDEFVVLASAGPEQAERIRRVLAEPFELDGRSVRISSSLGVATDDGSVSPEELVEYADVALYRAKELGRNRVALFEPQMLQDSGSGRGARRGIGGIDDERLNDLLAGN